MRFRSHPVLCTCLAVVLLGTSANAAEPQPTPESRAHFRSGVEALRGKRWVEAYREFQTAYQMTPKWTALGNLGVAAEHLERDGEAIDALAQYLERGGPEIDASEAERVLSTVDRLKKGMASVTLEAAGPFWIVDTRVVPAAWVVNEYGPFESRAQLRVRAGEHQFKLERTGVEAPVWSATLLPGDVATHAFVLPSDGDIATDFDRAATPPPDGDVISSTPSHTLSYALWGTGVAAGLATTVFLLEAHHVQNEADHFFDQHCPNGVTGMDGCDTTTNGDRKAAHWLTAALVTG